MDCKAQMEMRSECAACVQHMCNKAQDTACLCGPSGLCPR